MGGNRALLSSFRAFLEEEGLPGSLVDTLDIVAEDLATTTFESCRFKQVFDAVDYPEYGYNVMWGVQRSLEELPNVEPSANLPQCRSFFVDLDTKCNARFVAEVRNKPAGQDPLGALEPSLVAEAIWTANCPIAILGSQREFYWHVNWVIRLGTPDRARLLVLLMPFITALNRYSAPLRSLPTIVI